MIGVNEMFAVFVWAIFLMIVWGLIVEEGKVWTVVIAVLFILYLINN